MSSSENVLFKCKISQVTNIKTIIISLILTGLMFYFKDSIIGFLVRIAKLSPPQTLNIVDSVFVVFYLIVGFIWLRTLWRILVIYNTSYEFSDDRLTIQSGVLNKDFDYLEYFRIKDWSIKRPIIARMLNLFNVCIISTDRSHPMLNLNYINNFSGNERLLRERIEACSTNGRGREVDIV